MKQQNIGFLILGLALIGLSMEKCTNKGNFAPTNDTLNIVARAPNDQLFLDSAIVRITRKRKLDEGDSSNLSASFRIDTAVYLLQVIDTLRDSLKHPIFGINHLPKMLTRYSPLPVDDSLLQFVQLISIPGRGGKK